MKIPFNSIVEQLVKVFANVAEIASYYSENEQYICMCGWCGTMSPASRAAYIKTFGEDVTKAAERKAREIIADKRQARQRTKYHEHVQEANALQGVPAVGGFFWSDNSGLKCDGGCGLLDELHALIYYRSDATGHRRLCRVNEIINVSEEDFARPELANELVKKHGLQGGDRSDDVPKDADYFAIMYDEEKRATYYTVGVLVVAPSGKYFLIDSEGYDYARYIYVPEGWPVMFAEELERVKAKEAAIKAEDIRRAEEEKERKLAEYRERCAKWEKYMKDIRPLMNDPKTTPRKLMNARKANILAMCLAAFPGVAFSLTVNSGYRGGFDLTWQDGPTEEDFLKKTDLDLFGCYTETIYAEKDSADCIYADYTDFADMTIGEHGTHVSCFRKMSEEKKAEYLAKIFAAVPAAENRNKYGYIEAHNFTRAEAEAVASALGFDVDAFFVRGYHRHAEDIARYAWAQTNYTTPAEPVVEQPQDTAAVGESNEKKATDASDAPADGLQLVETADGVAVVGDSRTTYRNRKQIKAHGAKWNKTAQQWQASDAEAVARLREWFGVSDTPTAEEGDTANESKPQEEYTHTTESTPIDQIVDTLADVQQEDTPTASAPLLYEAGEIMATAPTDTAESDNAEPTTADGRKNGKTFSILGVRYNAPASLRENVRDWFAHNAPTADRDAIPADADFMSVHAALSVSTAAQLPDWCSSIDYLTRLLIYYGAAVCAAPASAGRHLSVPKKIVMVGMMQESARR